MRRSAAARLSAVPVALLLLLVACDRGPRVAIIGPGGIQRTVVRVEVADNEGARELGLMFRRHLDDDAGMLFVFTRPEHLTFWMKNTEIPLDMIFADATGKIVGIIAHAEPHSPKLLSVAGDSQYVLEVNGGFAGRFAVRAGDQLRFLDFSPRASD